MIKSIPANENNSSVWASHLIRMTREVKEKLTQQFVKFWNYDTASEEPDYKLL